MTMLQPLRDKMLYTVEQASKSFSPEELAFLMDQEPGSRKVQVHGISQGRQSTVDVLEFRLPPSNEKTLIVWKRMGVEKHLTEDEAGELHDRLRPYRRELRTAGWNVPKLFQTRLITDGPDFNVMSWEQYIPGGDGAHLVADPSQPNYRKEYLLQETLDALAEYGELPRGGVSGQKLSLMPHGLDLKLANLVLSPSNILYFIDLFGPKELDGAGNWVTYSSKLDSLPPEPLRAVTATREGAILRLFRLAEKTWVGSGTYDQEELRKHLPQLLRQAGLPDVEVSFVLDEIKSDYPWLDGLYQEERI